MSSRRFLLLAILAAPATARPQSLTTPSSPSPSSLHTAIYTTTLSSSTNVAGSPGRQEQWMTAAVVTVLTPRDIPEWPENGIQVVGTCISNMVVTHAVTMLPLPSEETPSKPVQEEECADVSISSWTTANSALRTWTLSGNAFSASRALTPIPPTTTPPATQTLTSTFTSTRYTRSTHMSDFAGREQEEWFTTSVVRLVEPVGPAFPTTIERAGYTDLTVTFRATNIASPEPFVTTATQFYFRTTTMVMIEPTAPVA